MPKPILPLKYPFFKPIILALVVVSLLSGAASMSLLSLPLLSIFKEVPIEVKRLIFLHENLSITTRVIDKY